MSLHFTGAVAAFIILAGLAGPAVAQDSRCPDNPAATFRFFEVQNPDQDKARLARLADDAKSHQLVCLLAWVDGGDPAYSKKLAIRRAVWVRDTLVAHGVPREIIAVEFRPTERGASEAQARRVDVILDR